METFLKISNTFLFLFSNKMLAFTAFQGLNSKMLVWIANRVYPDQSWSASSEAVWSGYALFVKAFLADK